MNWLITIIHWWTFSLIVSFWHEDLTQELEYLPWHRIMSYNSALVSAILLSNFLSTFEYRKSIHTCYQFIIQFRQQHLTQKSSSILFYIQQITGIMFCRYSLISPLLIHHTLFLFQHCGWCWTDPKKFKPLR